MSYTQAVKDAAAALVRGEDANWELARLTYENTNRKGERHKATHRQWSSDVRDASGRRFSETTSHKFAMMWERFGQDHTIVQSWTELWYELTPRDAAEPMRARAAKTHVGEAEADQVVETVREALKRPDVAKAVVSDHESNTTLARARQEYDREVQETAEIGTPQLRGARTKSEQHNAEHDLLRMSRDLDAIADQADGWDSVSDSVKSAAQDVAAKAAHLSSKLSGSFDEAVHELLGKDN